MTDIWTRRGFLGGLGAVSIQPAPGLASTTSIEAILTRSRLAKRAGFAVIDPVSGRTLESHRADAPRPPASVAKIPTALYALDQLGGARRFRTRLLATGPVRDGVIHGDLVLAGGGDPVFDTDALGEMVAALVGHVVAGVTGQLKVADGALPRRSMIEAGQPPQAAYNPSLGGMALNFNRVHLRWKQVDGVPVATFHAPGRFHSADPPGFAIALGDGGLPSHDLVDGQEVWTLPRLWLRGDGAVWLPVRRPALYAVEVLRALAGEAGIALPRPEVVSAAEGGELVGHDSADLTSILIGMLRYSTNLTAEMVGLHASGAADLDASGAAMTDWARRRYGLETATFLNHSGLTDRSAISAHEMVRILAAEADVLPDLMRPKPVLDAHGHAMSGGSVTFAAKTGTLHFTRGLAGYIDRERGARLAFAIFSADLDARAEITPRTRDKPPGGAGWLGRARGQERALLRRWAALHAPRQPLRPRPRMRQIAAE